jgi:hypothetical protein
MKVEVEISHTDVEGDYGRTDGLCLVCQRCGHEVEVPGTGGPSARYGAALLGKQCPGDEKNFYDVNYWG